MSFRLIMAMVTGLAVAGATGGQALACATVPACVAVARKTPDRFTPRLRASFTSFKRGKLILGLRYGNRNRLLQAQVRTLVAGELRRKPPARLSPGDLLRVTTALGQATAGRAVLIRVLSASPRGLRWLRARMTRKRDDLATRIALALSETDRLTKDRRALADDLVWEFYLRARLTTWRTNPELAVARYLYTHTAKSATRIRSLLQDSARKGQVLLGSDVSLYLRADRRRSLIDLIGWALHKNSTVALSVTGTLRNQFIVGKLTPGLQSALGKLLSATAASPQFMRRLLAVWAAGNLCRNAPVDAAGLSWLLKLAADRDVNVRSQAVMALEPVARLSKKTARVQKALAGALGDSSPMVVTAAVSVAYRLPVPSMVTLLKGLLRFTPKARYMDPRWHRVLHLAGQLLEQRSGKRYGFSPLPRRPRNPVVCGTGMMQQYHRRRELKQDRKIFGIDAGVPPAWSPPPIKARLIRGWERNVGKTLWNARKKMLAAPGTRKRP